MLFNTFRQRKYLWCVSWLLALLCACHKPEKKTLFQKLDPEKTGVRFSNTLSYDKNFNIYTYRNFYNGGGVALSLIHI